MSPTLLRVGTAAWSLPKVFANLFPGEGTHLQRYAQVFNAVELNTSFYREHRAQSYQKWALAVPPDFRFSVKLFRYFTHEQRLADYGPKLAKHPDDLQQLGKKLGVILVLLPPILNFEAQAEESGVVHV